MIEVTELVKDSVNEFEVLWSSLRVGSFEWDASKCLKFVSSVTSHFRTCNVLNRFGVYVIRSHATQSVVYIGKGGTIATDGRFKEQDIPKRLKAERDKKISGNAWFAYLYKKHGRLVIEYAFTQAIPKSPALLEAELMKTFLNRFRRLPDENKAF